MIVKKKTAWLKGVLIKVKFFFTKMLSKMLWLKQKEPEVADATVHN